jgi:hypothetical protein
MWRALLCFLCFAGVNAVLPDNIVPRLVFYARPAVTPNEPTLSLHTLRYVTFAWFETWATCNDTAVGPLFLGTLRRTNQIINCTLSRKNTAYAYAAYRILSQPAYFDFQSQFDAMMAEFELDPLNTSNDTSTPIGLGNYIGYAVRAFQAQDGFNNQGDLSGVDSGPFIGLPYSDYTQYYPKQTYFDMIDPDRYQPLVEQRAQGIGPFGRGFKTYGFSGIQDAQTYASPHLRYTRAFGFTSPVQFMSQFSPVFAKYNGGGTARKQAYIQQALDVITTQANLVDSDKIEAEYFESKNLAFGTPMPFLAANSRGAISGQKPWTVDDWVVWEFLVNAAVWDSVVVAWSVKRKRDCVRPISAIRYLYKDQTISSWGGPGKGTISQPGAAFRSWLRTMAHSEYPSGSSCMCASFAAANKNWYDGNDSMYNYSFFVPAGSSGVEPGVVPAVNSTLGPFATFTDYATRCGFSRAKGGVHFTQSIVDSLNVCRGIGENAASLWRKYLAGTVTQPVSPDERDHFPGKEWVIGTDVALN